MSRFTKELRVVPTAAWIVAWVFYACVTTLMFFYVTLPGPHTGQWPRWEQILLAYGIFLVPVVYIALIGYVYGDAKRRQMRYIMWTLLAIFIPDAIGIILYFILRDPLPKHCPGCGDRVKAGFVFCPRCGTSVEPTCPQCGKGVDASWMNCPHCGQRLAAPSPRTGSAPEDRPQSQVS